MTAGPGTVAAASGRQPQRRKAIISKEPGSTKSRRMSQRATTGGVCSRLFKSPGPRSTGEARAGCVEDGASDAASSEIETGGGVAAAAAAGAYAFRLSEALDKVEREAEAPLESIRGGAVVVVESASRRTEALPQEATTIWRRDGSRRGRGVARDRAARPGV